MNPIDVAIDEYQKTIQTLGSRLANLAVENAGLRAALLDAQNKEKQRADQTPAPTD